MKFALAFFLCSSIAETCLPPYVFDLQFDTEYDCLIKGYEESLDKTKEIGEGLFTGGVSPDAYTVEQRPLLRLAAGS